MVDPVKHIIAQQGWNDESVRTLLLEFIDDHDLTPALVDYLSDAAEVENEMAEFDEDEDVDEDPDFEGQEE